MAMSADEVNGLCAMLLPRRHTRSICSEKGVLDIAGVNGYYTALAMAMNTTRFPIPADAKRLPRWPE